MTTADEKIFSDLLTIKAPQDSGITITNKKWTIVVDQYTGYKKSEFYCAKSDFVKITYKKLANGKIMGNR